MSNKDIKHAKKNSVTWLVVAAIGFFGLILLIYWALLTRHHERRDSVTPSLTVQAVPVTERMVMQVVEAVGTARAIESVTIAANVTEYVVKINFHDGDWVEKGDVLIELDPATISAQYRDTLARSQEAALQHERIKQLVSRKFATKAELDTLEANMKSTRARLDEFEARLKYYQIVAPFSGVLGFRQISLGALIEPGDEIATLDKIQPIEVDFTVPEKYLSYLNRGRVLTVSSVAYPDAEFKGKIQTILNRIDEQTRSVTVRGRLDNNKHLLRPGMLLSIHLPLGKQKSLSVPEEALLAEGMQRYVFIVKNGLAKKIFVEIVNRDKADIAVRGNLKPGELVVTDGGFRLKDGQPVKVGNEAR